MSSKMCDTKVYNFCEEPVEVDTFISEQKESKIVNSPLKRQLFATSGVILLALGNGATSGYSATLLPQLEMGNSTIVVNREISSWVAAISTLPLFFANGLSGLIMERFGRRLSHLIICLPYIAGWIIIAYSESLTSLLIGRFITGFCQGLHGPLGPVFIGEISAPKYRGFLLPGISLAMSVGILYCHVIGTFLHWKTTAIVCALFPLFSYLVMSYLPETPSWLASKGRTDESIDAFKWFRGESLNSITELNNMLRDQEGELESKKKEGEDLGKKIRRLSDNLKRPEFLKPLLVMIMFFTITQFAGINVITFYTAHVMKEIIAGELSAHTAMIAIDLVRVVSSIAACMLSRRCGRRPLAMMSGWSTAATLLGLSLYLFLHRIGKVENISATVTMVLTLGFIATSTLGLTQLPWTMVGEVFPAASRGLGSGVSVMTSSIGFFIAIKTAPTFFAELGMDGTFLAYGCVAFLGTLFLCQFLPETKGKTLLEVENYYRNVKIDRRNDV